MPAATSPAEPLPDAGDLVALACEAAVAAGELLRRGQGGAAGDVGTKTSGTDMVTAVDRASEALITGALLAARPHDAVLGEEGGLSGAGTSGVRWIVDPLDGTTNYLYGFPVWAVSIAAEHGGDVVAAVVHDPTHGETFTAVRGGGAACNGRSLRVTGAPELGVALLATGFGYEASTRVDQGAVVARVLPHVRDLRRAGAASVDLCWVALGRVDLYYERGLQPWDRAAGMLIAAEAGAVVALLADDTTVAAPPHLYRPLLDLIAGRPPR
ncbi:MAG: inositol monophosphatase family protein [Acidimicrobiia bacterium]